MVEPNAALVLDSVNSGSVIVTGVALFRGTPYMGALYEFALSSGWRVIVGADYGSWYYVDHLVSPDGVHVDGQPFGDFEPDEERWHWPERSSVP